MQLIGSYSLRHLAHTPCAACCRHVVDVPLFVAVAYDVLDAPMYAGII